MSKSKKTGIVICDRYRNCAGGKCFRAMKNNEGAFSMYDDDTKSEVVAYPTCGGCPGGNVEYAPEQMKKNGVEGIHIATGLVVGYPPYPYTSHFKQFIEQKYKIPVVVGTHSIPQNYGLTHQKLKTLGSEEWQELIAPTFCDEKIRLFYD
ncbi:MAG: CGGC domain-containing protein [Bacteroidia bacterium]|nr:CGGC domain-containing protein [Bacteroidia bacterium]